MRRRVWRSVALGGCAALWLAACGWNPSRPFERESPEVKRAMGELGDGGDAAAAAALLQDYLATGKCKDGNIGVPDAVRQRSSGGFDLGLALFRIGEQYGRRFGEEEVDAGDNPEQRKLRLAEIDCALRVVQAIAADESQPIDLRARARYLEGNLHFLAGEYQQAVDAYDKALALAPGQADAGDPVGRDAAWNRAIALERIEDQQKDAGSDGGNDGGPGDGGPGDGGGQDGGSDGGNDGGGGNDAGDAGDGGGGGNDGGQDGGGNDGGADAGQPPPQPDEADAGSPPPSTQSEDDRILEQLENAPTFQHEVAKHAARHRRVTGMADK